MRKKEGVKDTQLYNINAASKNLLPQGVLLAQDVRFGDLEGLGVLAFRIGVGGLRLLEVGGIVEV